MKKRTLVLSKSFQKSYKKFIAKKPALKSLIQTALVKMEEDAFYQNYEHIS